MERAMRFELTTPTLARLCSTPELRPLEAWFLTWEGSLPGKEAARLAGIREGGKAPDRSGSAIDRPGPSAPTREA